MKTDNVEAVREQVKYEVGIEKFLAQNGIGAFAATKPEIDVIPLEIGGKEDPARLIFDGVTGDSIQVTMVDMGDHFRIICADIELVK